MKTNPNDLVQMMYDLDGHPVGVGLTKREYFAAIAMQGILPSNDIQIEFVAHQAVKFADALISALNETSTSKQ